MTDITKISKYGYDFFDEKTGSGASVNEELPLELHKPGIIFGQQI